MSDIYIAAARAFARIHNPKEADLAIAHDCAMAMGCGDEDWSSLQDESDNLFADDLITVATAFGYLDLMRLSDAIGWREYMRGPWEGKWEPANGWNDTRLAAH